MSPFRRNVSGCAGCSDALSHVQQPHDLRARIVPVVPRLPTAIDHRWWTVVPRRIGVDPVSGHATSYSGCHVGTNGTRRRSVGRPLRLALDRIWTSPHEESVDFGRSQGSGPLSGCHAQVTDPFEIGLRSCTMRNPRRPIVRSSSPSCWSVAFLYRVDHLGCDSFPQCDTRRCTPRRKVAGRVTTRFGVAGRFPRSPRPARANDSSFLGGHSVPVAYSPRLRSFPFGTPPPIGGRAICIASTLPVGLAVVTLLYYGGLIRTAA